MENNIGIKIDTLISAELRSHQLLNLPENLAEKLLYFWKTVIDDKKALLIGDEVLILAQSVIESNE